jgi:hypothetical protein
MMTDALFWVKPKGAKVEHKVRSRSDLHALCQASVSDGALWVSRPQAPCLRCSEIDQANTTADFIEQLLDLLERQQPKWNTGSSIKPKPSWFDGAEPYMPEFLRMTGRMTSDETVPNLLSPRDVRWPMDVRVIANTDEPGEFHATIYRGLEANSIRGRVSPALPFPTMVGAWLLSEGYADTVIFGLRSPQDWADITANRASRPAGADNEWSRRIQVALGLAYLKPAQWRVYVSLGGLGLEFQTDPLGAREFFRLRDVPDGKERRTALRHWVTEHWRMNSRDPREEVKVREHLRGSTEFHWSGLRCRIRPSTVDLGRAMEAAEQRMLDRLTGEDRRLAV